MACALGLGLQARALALEASAAGDAPKSTAKPPARVGVKGPDKSPSMDKVRWTEAKMSSDLRVEYDFVGGSLREHYTDIRYTATRRTLLAFLLTIGAEYQRTGFDGRKGLLVPGQLSTANGYLALDFRWSQKDMMRIQARPGFYGDFELIDSQSFNAPVDIAYTRVPSKRLQWAFGISIDMWRKYRVLPGGGFRYMITDRWKLKAMMPQPQIEYKAQDNLHVFFGMDFRGDTYRLAKDFGRAHNRPGFNNALVDYSEIRVGPGFSWNIRPLIELDLQGGILLQRQFDYHNNDYALVVPGRAPFINVSLHCLFKHSPPEIVGPEIESGRFSVQKFYRLLRFL